MVWPSMWLTACEVLRSLVYHIAYRPRSYAGDTALDTPPPRTPSRSGSLSAHKPMGKLYAQTFPKLHLHILSCKAIGPNADVAAGCATIPVETCSHHREFAHIALHQPVLWTAGHVPTGGHVNCIVTKGKQLWAAIHCIRRHFVRTI